VRRNPVLRFLSIVSLLAISACRSDPCVTCNTNVEARDISGVWTVSHAFSESGAGVTVLVEKHLVLELTQQDSIVVGRMGGTIERCTTSSSGDVCSTNVLYSGVVLGRVHTDASVVLSWMEDLTHVELEGKAGASGMTGLAQGAPWNARRATPVTVAEARSGTGDTVLVSGVVTVDQGAFDPGNVVYVQDKTAGIEVVGLGTGPMLVKGDSVLLRGVIGADGAGERAILPIAAAPSSWPPEIVWEGTGAVPAPRVVTAADMRTRQYEGSIISLPSGYLHVLVRQAGPDYGMWFGDVNDADFQVFVHESVAASVPFDSWTVGWTYNLTGIQGFGVSLVSSSQPLLQIRGPDDRVPS